MHKVHNSHVIDTNDNDAHNNLIVWISYIPSCFITVNEQMQVPLILNKELFHSEIVGKMKLLHHSFPIGTLEKMVLSIGSCQPINHMVKQRKPTHSN